MDTDLTSMTHDSRLFYSTLDRLGCQVRGKSCTCPSPEHDDSNPSAHIHDDDGHMRVFCEACHRQFDTIDLLAFADGTDQAEVIRNRGDLSRSNGEPLPNHSKRDKVAKNTATDEIWPTLEAVLESLRPDHVYRYWDDGRKSVKMAVMRYDAKGGRGKYFRQCSPTGTGWVLKAPPKPWPILNLPSVSKSDEVVIVEGEGGVAALHRAAVVATTSPCGAGKAINADWSGLAGKKVFIWPDNDDAGLKHGEQLVDILGKLSPAPRIYVVDPSTIAEDLPPKYDAADFVSQCEAAGMDQEEINANVWTILSQAKPRRRMHAGLVGIMERIKDIRAGDTVSLPWPGINKHINGLAPRSLTIVCGSPGASKSWGAIQCIRHWHHTGTRWAASLLEDTIAEQIERIAVQENAMQWMTNDEQLSLRSEEAINGMERISDLAHEAEEWIRTTDRKEPPTPESIYKWANEMGKKGVKALIIDPLTMVRSKLDPWRLAEEVCDKLLDVANEHKMRIILVTHPRDSGDMAKMQPTMNGIAGGKAYQRFAHNIFWLEYMEERTVNCVHPGDGVIEPMQLNRKMHVLKSRRGSGPAQFGMWFEKSDLTIRERGAVAREKI